MNLEWIIPFFLKNYIVISFYVVVALLVYVNRHKFEVQANIIFLYRTKIGLKLIDKIGTKFKEIIKLLGYIGIGVGFLGMIYISWYVLSGFIDLLFVPDALPTITPALPGVKIPGSPMVIPFVNGIIAIFLATLIHEFAHGIVAKAHGLKVNSTGIAFFGPLFAAFVEPDEKQLRKGNDIVQYSIFSAGPWSNVIFATIALLLLTVVTTPLQVSMLETDGFQFYTITPYGPAFNASVPALTTFTQVNGVKVEDQDTFINILDGFKPGDEVTISNDEKTFSFEAMPHPSIKDKALIGINGRSSDDLIKIIKGEELRNPSQSSFFKILSGLDNFLFWFFVLSLGLGLANLLPAGPVDGGRMLQTFLLKLIPDEKKSTQVWSKIGVVTAVIIVISLLIPILKAVFGGLFL